MYEIIAIRTCSGTLSDGKRWEGKRLVVAKYADGASEPYAVVVLKCSPVFRVGDDVPSRVNLYFDEVGRVMSYVAC